MIKKSRSCVCSGGHRYSPVAHNVRIDQAGPVTIRKSLGLEG
jgi:hypothetical protein